MAAYAALTSLKHTLDRLEDHPLPPISPDPDQLEDHPLPPISPDQDQLEDCPLPPISPDQDQHEDYPLPPISLDKQQAKSLTEKVTFLLEFLETYHSPVADSNEADPLEMRIADAAYAAEDVIESNIVDRILLHGSESQIESNIVDRILPHVSESQQKHESQRKKMGFFSCCFSRPSPEEPAADGEIKINSLDLYKGLQPSPEEPAADGEIKINSLELYEALQKVIDDLDLIKIEAMEIIDAEEEKKDGVRIQLQRQVSASSSSSLTRLDNSINCGIKIDSKYGPHQGMRKVIKGMDLIKKDVMEIKKEKAIAIESHMSASGASTSRSSIMVGLDDVLLQILDKLTGGHSNRQVIPIVGMGGIGKTTLALHIYAVPLVKERFDVCAWATISQKHNSKEILSELLSQASKKSKEELSYMSEDEVGLELFQYLSFRRFLIVLDDMWSIDAWDEIQRFFPENGNGSRIVVTTRLSTLGSELGNDYCLKMNFLDEGSSWDLFSKSVFGEGSCPLELEEIGKQIVKNCRGLPLSIVVVGGLLRKMEHTNECWESIRENLSSIMNSENEDFSLKILKTSYNHLPVHLKPCFLYTGVFEEDRVIRVSTLVKLWISEGFLRPIRDKSLEMIAKEYLRDLVERNLILVHELGCTGNIKYCKIHDLLRDLCWREAEKEGFYNVIGPHKFQGSSKQRCVVIRESTSKEEVHDALKSLPLVRSLVYDSKEVLPLPESRLLRTLKAYDRDTSGSQDYLLDDVFGFANLRYLAVGVHHESHLSPSLGLLWNLHTIVIFHPVGDTAPNEIWNMPQLRHVEFHKGDLTLPKPDFKLGRIAIMKNLQTLKGVRSLWDRWYADVHILIPNIKKLVVTDGRYLNIQFLTKLESYRCWGSKDVMVYNFPYYLKKLSLGSTFHWNVDETMLGKIGALPHLQKLKLEQARFKPSHEWVTKEDQFPSLKFLELNRCLLKSWMTENSHFPRLEKLCLFGMKELEEIPLGIGEIPTLQSILLEYCSESVVVSAKSIAEEQEDLQVRVVLFNNSNSQELRSLSSPNFLVELVDF